MDKSRPSWAPVSGDTGGATFDELYAIVRANRGDDLRAAGEGWSRAADLLDRQADTLAAGLPTLERDWGSETGRAQADAVGALVSRMRATADVARYNHAQILAAADATDEAIRQLDLVRESAERDAAAREVADALNETYANAAARLTEPVLEVRHLSSPSTAGRSGPRLLFSGTRVPAAGEASLGAVVGPDPSVPSVALAVPSVPPSVALSVALSVSPEGQSRAPTVDLSDDPGSGDEAWGIDIDPDLPDAVGSVLLPASRALGALGGGRGDRFPATPPPAVVPILPVPAPCAQPGSPVHPGSTAGPRTASSGPPAAPAATSGAAAAAPRPTISSRRAEETYTDTRGHHVRIRWRGDGSVEPRP